VAPSDSKVGAEKPPPTNWAKIYSQLVCHTSIRYEEISNRTIPQIEAILAELPENISIKIGMPSGILAGTIETPEPTQNTGKPPKLSEFMNFANAFND
jgi:hypothetical protein